MSKMSETRYQYDCPGCAGSPVGPGGGLRGRQPSHGNGPAANCDRSAGAANSDTGPTTSC